MFSAIIQFFLVFFIATAMAEADGIGSTSASSTMTVSQARYPPSGLLDSIHSMRVREELYQSELSELAARQLDVQPKFSLPSTDPVPTGIIASLSSIQSLYHSLLLLELNGESTTSMLLTSTTDCQISAITTTPNIREGLPTPPPKMAIYATPQTSNAPQPQVLISIVWVLLISFIIGTTLYTALNGLGTFVLSFLVLNVICAVIVGAEAHSNPQYHTQLEAYSRLESRHRSIGGLRPGPVGKIPCGPVRGRIGTKHGHGFVHGVDRKIGGLTPVLEELMCDDWSNAKSLFGREMAAPTMSADEADKEMQAMTTTIYTTTEKIGRAHV